MADDSGMARADRIVMNQMNGDMDATGHVLSTHAPDKNEKPGTSMLDTSQPMQASAEEMHTREDNSQVAYRGRAVMWQGANRISADRIDVDRDGQSLHAVGDVVSELVDNKSDAGAPLTDPVFTVSTRARVNVSRRYSGGVVYGRRDAGAREDDGYLEADARISDSENGGNGGDSSLDHAIADGEVTVTEVLAGNRKRSGAAEHGEYYTKEDKVVLNGGDPQIVDSIKGMTRGRQLTYFTDEDHLIVEGVSKKVAFTRMKKK